MIYGIPIQILSTTSKIFAVHSPSQSEKFAASAMESGRMFQLTKVLVVLINSLPSTPESSNRRETYRSETNCGIAMVITSTVLQNFLILIPFLLIMMATNIPRK